MAHSDPSASVGDVVIRLPREIAAYIAEQGLPAEGSPYAIALQDACEDATQEKKAVLMSDHDELAYQAWGFAFAALAPTRTMEQPPPEWLKLFADATRGQPDLAKELRDESVWWKTHPDWSLHTNSVHAGQLAYLLERAATALAGEQTEREGQ